MNCKRPIRRRAFSLAEVVVAVGILALMMTLTSEVMTLTMEATGRAKAITEVNQLIRICEQTLRDDLSGIDPERSVIVIQGNPIAAYWTQDGKDGDDNDDPIHGYPHPRDPQREDPLNPGDLDRPRADILMFFTTRKQVTNYVPYKYDDNVPPNLARGVSSNVQQVVYGHAELGEYVADPGGPEPYIFEKLVENAFPAFEDGKEEAISPIPAERWHLARRSVVLTPITLPDDAASPPWADYGGGYGLGHHLADPQILLGATDVMGTFDYEKAVLTPQFENPRYLPEIFGPQSDRIKAFDRSRLDPTPPPLYSSRLGHYFMPHCASFKVEWAIDPRSQFVGRRLDDEKQLYWMDEGNQGVLLADHTDDDPLAMLQQALDDAVGSPYLTDREDNLTELLSDGLGGQFPRYSLRERFGGDPFWIEADLGENPLVERPNLAIFTPKRMTPDPNDPTVGIEIPDNLFPVALRITIDMFDRERRLERPIRHVMIIPVG